MEFEVETRYQMRPSALCAGSLNRVLSVVVQLDQPIDRRPATAASATCAASLADIRPAPCAVVDASANRVVVDRVAVANQHASLYSRQKLQIKFNKRCP